jgi:purine nucleoside phosphorylase
MERDGCDLVGMTECEETLARVSVPYATLAVVANHAAAGRQPPGISLGRSAPPSIQTMARVHRILGEFVRVAAREQ